MEFGAIQCKPKNPDCIGCPLNKSCASLQHKLVKKFPIKENRIKIKKRFLNYLVFTNPYNQTQIEQRESKDIWQGLYQFPLIESPYEVDKDELLKIDEFQIYAMNFFRISLFNEEAIIHKLSHQHLFVKFWILHSQQKINHAILWSEIKNYPVPILIHNFAEKYQKIK